MPRLTLGWSRLDGVDGLRVDGFAGPARDRLARAGPDELARLLPVYPGERVGGPPASELRARFPSTRGRYVVDGRSVCFVPRFPFRAGTTYRVLVAPELVSFRPGRGGDPDGYVELAIDRPPGDRGEPARVLRVEPTAATLPRNHLRCYVWFSHPMSEGQAAAHVHLRRADTGEKIDDAFLAFDPELWDGSHTRLTVLLDPARIKRGLVPHREAGYPLGEGVDVEFVVDDGFRDAQGAPLEAGCVRRYAVGPDLRSHVDPSTWEREVPAAGSTDELVVRFDRPLDAALLGRCLQVVDETGASVRGTGAIGPEERSWSFRPYRPWRPVRHELVVDAVLEDVAGNSVTRVFDRDLGEPGHEPRAVEGVGLPFVPA